MIDGFDQSHQGLGATANWLAPLLRTTFRDREIVELKELAKSLPGRPHLSSIYRWSSSGLRGVRLETFKLGGRRYTSRVPCEIRGAALRPLVIGRFHNQEKPTATAPR